MKINYIYNTELTSKLPVLTYAELRDMLPAVKETALPHLKTMLTRINHDRFLSASGEDISITVYRDGVYLYQEQGALSVCSVSMAVERMNRDYTSLRDNGQALGMDMFPLCPWYLPLVIAGQTRLKENADKKQSKIRERLMKNPDMLTTEVPDFAGEWFRHQEETDSRQDARHRMEDAKKTLTEREREVVRLLFDLELTRNQTAESLNVTPQCISTLKMRALARLKAAMSGNAE